MPMIRLLLVPMLVAAGGCVSADKPMPASASPIAVMPAPGQAALATEGDRILAAAYNMEGPGAAVIVTRAGEVIYARERGLADLESGRPIAPDTVFRVASIAKQFTAATILQLVAEGRVSLDDPLARFLPDWPEPAARATVRQLLNHTSGLFDLTKIPGYMMSEPTLRANTTEDLLAVIRSRPAKAEPGTEWEYNNGGYIVLGAIIEKVTGNSWSAEVDRRIARPFGLASMSDAVSADGRPTTARFYGKDGDRYVPARGAHISVAHAAGNLAMSVSDMAKWAHALHSGKMVAPALYAEMISPAKLADGSTEEYGFGLRLATLLGKPIVAHGGGGRGVDTYSLFVPGDDLFAAVFSNSDRLPVDSGTVGRRLALAALGRPVPLFESVAVDGAELEPLFGSYQPIEGEPHRFFTRDGKIYVGRGRDEREAFAAGGGRFFFGPDDLLWIAFERQPEGSPTMVVHRPDLPEPVSAARSGDVPAPFAVAAEVLRTYAGVYKTEVPTMTVVLNSAGRLTIAPEGGDAMVMRAVSETEFHVDEGGFTIEFHPAAGRTDRMTMKRGARTLNGSRIAS